jgi:hypothetical protein
MLTHAEILLSFSGKHTINLCKIGTKLKEIPIQSINNLI